MSAKYLGPVPMIEEKLVEESVAADPLMNWKPV